MVERGVQWGVKEVNYEVSIPSWQKLSERARQIDTCGKNPRKEIQTIAHHFLMFNFNDTETQTQRHRDNIETTQRHRETQRQHRDTETQGNRDTGKQGHRDTGKQRHRDTETREHRDTETTQRHRDTKMINRTTMS